MNKFLQKLAEQIQALRAEIDKLQAAAEGGAGGGDPEVITPEQQAILDELQAAIDDAAGVVDQLPAPEEQPAEEPPAEQPASLRSSRSAASSNRAGSRR